jgi:hypothetical protein
MEKIIDQTTSDADRGVPERLVFVDALRVAIVAMVIAHHAAQAYGPTGGAWPVTDEAQSDWFRPFYTVNAAVGLGLLFFVAGYFVPGSCDRKGSRRFLRDRWRRIGVPLVIFAVGVHLPFVYLLQSGPAPGDFVRSLYEGGWFLVYLHLWFLGHLLLYSVLYVAWRRLSRRAGGSDRPLPPPNHLALATFLLGLAVVTWIVRWWFPIDDWEPLFFVLAAEPAHLPQYLSLFTVGILAYHGDWLRRLPDAVGWVWLGIGVTASVGMYTLQGLAPDRWDDLVASGGLNWPSLVRATWESLLCVSLSAGLIVLFRTLFHRPRRLLAGMATASYAAYILHLWIVLAIQAGIEGSEPPAVAKFIVVAGLGIGLSFGIGHLSGKVPGLRFVLGAPNPSGRSFRRGRPHRA